LSAGNYCGAYSTFPPAIDYVAEKAATDAHPSPSRVHKEGRELLAVGSLSLDDRKAHDLVLRLGYRDPYPPLAPQN
jgi:hypothetical protein